MGVLLILGLQNLSSAQTWNIPAASSTSSSFIGTTGPFSLDIRAANQSVLQSDGTVLNFLNPRFFLNGATVHKYIHSFGNGINNFLYFKFTDSFPFSAAAGSTILAMNRDQVGIGTTTPSLGVKLDIRSNASGSTTDRNVVLRLSNGYNSTSNALNEPTMLFDNGMVTTSAYSGYGWTIGARVAGTPSYFRIGKYTGSPAVHTEYLRIKDDGTMLVGTNGDYLNGGNNKLAVKGRIICEEITAALYGGWPDFVFAKEYKLQPLAELETYIKANQHLPGIPSAKELQEKEGLALADMLTKQMQKIEELSLYIIELNKKVIALEAANSKKGGQ